MKKIFLFTILWFIYLGLAAQVPQGFNYQAVARDASGSVMPNKSVAFRISILSGSSSGSSVYSEVQKKTTNSFGLVDFIIGDGTSKTGSFDAIDWSANTYFVRVEFDPEGGTAYQLMGTSQLLSVPYALHAKTVEIDQVDDADADPTNEIQTLSKTGNTVTLSKNGGSFTDAVDDADADPTNELQTLSLSGTSLTLSKNGGTVTLPSSGGGDNWGTQTAVTNATLAGNGSTASPLKIAQQGATAGQTLKWNGSSWTPGNEAKEDSVNEIQTLSLSGTSLTLSKNGGTVTLPSSGGGDNWGTQTAVTNATLEGNGSTASPLKIAQQGATAGQTLKWNGSTWAPGDDAKGAGLTLPYSDSISYSYCGFSISNSLGMGIKGESSSPNGTGVFGGNSSPTGYPYGVAGYTCSPHGISVYADNSSSGIGAFGSSLSGTGVFGTSIAGTGVFGRASQESGVTYGVNGSNFSPDGIGVYGYNDAKSGSAIGIKGESASPDGTGVNGINSSDTGYTFGVVGTTSSPYGVSVYGNNFSSGNGVFGSSVSGTGVSGHALLGSGVTYGVTGSVISPDGVGVYGHNDANSGYAIGVKGESSSSYGTGVYGKGEGCGVYGISNSSAGVRGTTKADYASGVFGAGTGKGTSSGVYGDAGESVSPPMPGNAGVLGQANEHIGVAGTAVSGIGGYFSSYSGLALQATGGIQLTGIGEAAGKVLTSDDQGNATWQTGSSKLELPYYNKTSADEKAFSITNDLNTAIEGYSTGAATLASGVKGVATLGSGLGVFGLNLADSGLGVGVRGYSNSSEGYGVYGSGGEAGVYGLGTNYGVLGESSSPVGAGVYGKCERYGVSGDGDRAGVYGYSGSNFGYGVIGNGGNGGVYGIGSNYGVFGESSSSDGTGVYGGSEDGIGVYGSSNGYAGYFDGRLIATGNVGIGTNSPGYKLDVAGSINLNKGSAGGAIYCNGNEALWFNGDCYSWGYGGTWNFFQRKVHIGGSNYNPAYMLYVEGDAAKSTGSSVWIIASDIRLKDIQGNYEKGVSEIVKLKPVKFNYKAGNACNLPSDQNYVGFIAQDVQKVFPEAVSEGKDGYLSLDVNAINVAMVNAIKELKAENDELKARLEKLERLMEANGIK